MPDTRKLEPAHGWPRSLALVGLFSGAYFAACCLGLAIARQTDGIVTVWPASGILLAVLLLVKPRAWPLWLVPAFVITFATYLFHGKDLLPSFALAAAHSAESSLAAGLFVWCFGTFSRLDTYRALLGLVLLCALGGNSFSALLGAGIVWWESGLPLRLTWPAWFLSAASSTLVVTPALVYLFTGGLAGLRNCGWARIAEAIFLYLLLVAAGILIIGAPLGDSWVQRALLRPILCYPLLLWAAFRFGPRGTSLGVLIIAIIAVVHTLRGEGVFALPPPVSTEHLLALDGYLGFASVLALFPALHIATGQKVEAALHESERRLRLALQAARMGIWEWEIETNRVYWSDQIEPMLGLAKGEFAGTYEAFFEMIEPEDRERFSSVWSQALEHPNKDDRYSQQFRLRRRDGERQWLENHAFVMRDANGKPTRMLGTVTDITAQRLAEEKLKQGEIELAHVARLSTLGELVAGISHEITQPLSAISNYAAACSTALEADPSPAGERLLDWTRQISAQANRAGGIITRLRNFSRKGLPDRVPLDLNELIEESVELIAFETRRAGITVELVLAADLPLIPADRVQIQQVVINLLRNANDALRLPETRERRVVVSSHLVDGACEVRVADHGPGVSESAVDQLFTPFYTTKTQGLGLGLPISRSIIDAHGGRIWLEPTAGGGATFCISFPLAAQRDAQTS